MDTMDTERVQGGYKGGYKGGLQRGFEENTGFLIARLLSGLVSLNAPTLYYTLCLCLCLSLSLSLSEVCICPAENDRSYRWGCCPNHALAADSPHCSATAVLRVCMVYEYTERRMRYRDGP